MLVTGRIYTSNESSASLLPIGFQWLLNNEVSLVVLCSIGQAPIFMLVSFETLSIVLNKYIKRAALPTVPSE